MIRQPNNWPSSVMWTKQAIEGMRLPNLVVSLLFLGPSPPLLAEIAAERPDRDADSEQCLENAYATFSVVVEGHFDLHMKRVPYRTHWQKELDRTLMEALAATSAS
jgi:hypothetical protein